MAISGNTGAGAGDIEAACPEFPRWLQSQLERTRPFHDLQNGRILVGRAESPAVPELNAESLVHSVAPRPGRFEAIGPGIVAAAREADPCFAPVCLGSRLLCATVAVSAPTGSFGLFSEESNDGDG